jgi:hypothetical protein
VAALEHLVDTATATAAHLDHARGAAAEAVRAERTRVAAAGPATAAWRRTPCLPDTVDGPRGRK